jgi:hypothetical protein
MQQMCRTHHRPPPAPKVRATARKATSKQSRVVEESDPAPALGPPEPEPEYVSNRPASGFEV